MVPAPAPAVAPSTAEREPKPAKPSVAEAESRTGEPAAKKAAPAEGTPAKKAAQAESAVAKKPAPADGAKVAAAPGGDYWVQVGVFQREDNAEALARSVREKTKMPARIGSRPARSSVPTVTPARHEVFVTGAQVTTVNAALKGRGSAHAVRGGVAVQPPLELKEAVALSQRLSGEGMNVKIRRVGGEGVGAADPGVAYVVRVGGYGTRAQAEAAKRELARKGVNGFVTPVSTAAAR
jgi:cell division septation protein DedD